ncbi:hypothetical protein KGA66_12875 [Actinocrinis puniceicyclus]|uniref:DUF6545 domain-containing protein n=1 Tax=Actinocrinis puniceicyclus TaxID=977794 RepID=A0A8J7WPH9_9ACTN|nr:MAB_1171c family putative transporter [Actinocrinis puniceicyclus]MBS2963942.1 hypothetical protein [Actinocrinis puniceicyclus]
MNSTLYPLCALFAWIVALRDVRRLPALLKPPSRLATWAMYVFFALIFTTGWSAVWDRIDRWTGLAEANTLITMCWVVCYSASALALLQLWTYQPHEAGRRVRFTVVSGVLVLAAMVTLFLRSDTVHQHQQSFTDWYGGSAEYTAYLLLYLAAFTIVELEVIRLCRRYARVTSRSWLRTGLITAGFGAAIGLLYSFTRLADLAAARLGADLSQWENVAEVGAGLGALLVMVGLTLHSWGPRISAAALHVKRLRAYAALAPLWSALNVRDPSIVLEPGRREGGDRPASRWRAAVRVLTDPDYHVTRRVVEIRDGLLALRPYLDHSVTERARTHFEQRGLHGDALDAAVTAAQIHTLLDASPATARRTAASTPAPGNTPADIDAELAWLVKLAHAYAEPPADLSETGRTDPLPTGGAT